jgi:hypothetical protein
VGDPESPFFFNWPLLKEAFPDQPAYVAREGIWHFFPLTIADLWQLFEAHRGASAIPDPARRGLCVGRGQDDFEIAVTSPDKRIESCCTAFSKRFDIKTRLVLMNEWQREFLLEYRHHTEVTPSYTDLWRNAPV